MLKLSLFESYEVAVVIGLSGRVMAFCLSRPGLKPRMDLAFIQFRFAVNPFQSILAGRCALSNDV